MSRRMAAVAALLLLQSLVLAQAPSQAPSGASCRTAHVQHGHGATDLGHPGCGRAGAPVQPGVPRRAARSSSPSARGACESSRTARCHPRLRGRRRRRRPGPRGRTTLPMRCTSSCCIPGLPRTASSTSPTRSTGLAGIRWPWAGASSPATRSRTFKEIFVVGRLGELRRQPGAHVVHARRHAARHRRRPRPLLLRRVREHQPAHEGPDAGQRLRQDSAHPRRRQHSARQSVRRACGRAAANLQLRASQRLRPRLPSRDGRTLGIRDRAPGRRRGQHPVPGHNYGWPLVSTGRNYTGTRVSDRRGPARAWTTRGCSGIRRSARRV